APPPPSSSPSSTPWPAARCGAACPRRWPPGSPPRPSSAVPGWSWSGPATASPRPTSSTWCAPRRARPSPGSWRWRRPASPPPSSAVSRPSSTGTTSSPAEHPLPVPTRAVGVSVPARLAEEGTMSRTDGPPASFNARILGISLAAALGGFLFGFDTAVINGAIDAMSADFGISGFLQGFTVSSALLGCVVGAWFAGPLAARQGRVRVMVVAAVLFTASAVGSRLAFGTWDLIAWRSLGGLGVGAASVIAPAYIAEVSPADVRGRLGSLQQLAIVLGIFAALLCDAFLADAAGGAAEQLWLGREAWRWMFMAEAVPAVLYGLFALTIPESPRYLVDQEREEEAADVLTRYTGVREVA